MEAIKLGGMLMVNVKKYKIGEFSQLVGLSTFTLRYYENEGIIKPHRDHNGMRYYTMADIKWVGFVLHLKGTGMKITALKEYVALRAARDATIPARRALLAQAQKDCEAEIAERQANLQVLNHKIDWYDGKLDASISETESFETYLKHFE